MQTITGKPPIVGDVVFIIFNVLFGVWVITWGSGWLLLPLVFTITSTVRLVRTLNSGISVDETGVSCKIKKQKFQLAYHEISAVSLADADNRKTLLLVCGYDSHSIRITNAEAVRAVIAHNMAVLQTQPAPVPASAAPLSASAPPPVPAAMPVSGRVVPTPLQRVQRTRKWILILLLASVGSFILEASGVRVLPLPFSSFIAFFAYGMFGWIAGMLVIAAYFFLWVFLKKRHSVIVVALVFVALEILWATFSGALVGFGGFLIFLFLSILPYAWILFCLIRGIIAWRKIPPAPPPDEPVAQVLPTDVVYTGAYPAAEMSDYLRERIIALYKREIAGIGGVSNFYVLEEIPTKKLENAMSRYASSLEKDETVIFLFDGTIAGSGKSGLLLTTKCLYTKFDLEKATKSYVKNIARVASLNEHRHDRFKVLVEMDTGNSRILILSPANLQKKAAIAHVLDETILLLKQ